MAIRHDEQNTFGQSLGDLQRSAMQNAFGQTTPFGCSAMQNAFRQAEDKRRTYKDDIEDMERDLKLLLRIN